jgi:hypothetical protein
MTQDLLDDLVGDAEPVKIRSQPAPKSVPTMLRNLLALIVVRQLKPEPKTRAVQLG